MTRLMFVMPAHGREQLAAICLRQLRRTCDALTDHGIHASAVVVADDGNLETARSLGFGTIVRNNDALAAKFNDGFQAALDPECRHAPTDRGGFLVLRHNGYRGHKQGTRFIAKLPERAVARAVARGDIEVLGCGPVTYERGSYVRPDGWDDGPADYVVPIGSDDWIDWRILLTLPSPDRILGFRELSFVREDGKAISHSVVGYPGGCGMRVYPRAVMALAGFRPADEDLTRACDTSTLNNLRGIYRNMRRADLPIAYGDQHPRQIVDWKNPDEQINAYKAVSMWQQGEDDDPFEQLAGTYPADALDEMKLYYQQVNTNQHQEACNG